MAYKMERRISVSKYGGPDKLNIPVTCKTTKKLADNKVDVIDNLSSNEKEVIGVEGKMDKSLYYSKQDKAKGQSRSRSWSWSNYHKISG